MVKLHVETVSAGSFNGRIFIRLTRSVLSLATSSLSHPHQPGIISFLGSGADKPRQRQRLAGYVIGRTRHTSHSFDSGSATMSDGPGYHNRQERFSAKIRSLLLSLCNEPSNYDLIAPKIEYWIEYVLREQSTTVDELVEGVSQVAWCNGGSYAIVGRFFKELRDAPHCSEQARTFVTRLCDHVLWWFAAASADDLRLDREYRWSVSHNGGQGFIRAASFVGHLINWGLLRHEFVRRHLAKPLIIHYYGSPHSGKQSPTVVRASAVYQLFTAAGNALLQDLLDPEDVQACFQILDAEARWIEGFHAEKLQV